MDNTQNPFDIDYFDKPSKYKDNTTRLSHVQLNTFRLRALIGMFIIGMPLIACEPDARPFQPTVTTMPTPGDATKSLTFISGETSAVRTHTAIALHGSANHLQPLACLIACGSATSFQFTVTLVLHLASTNCYLATSSAQTILQSFVFPMKHLQDGADGYVSTLSFRGKDLLAPYGLDCPTGSQHGGAIDRRVLTTNHGTFAQAHDGDSLARPDVDSCAQSDHDSRAHLDGDSFAHFKFVNGSGYNDSRARDNNSLTSGATLHDATPFNKIHKINGVQNIDSSSPSSPCSSLSPVPIFMAIIIVISFGYFLNNNKLSAPQTCKAQTTSTSAGAQKQHSSSTAETNISI